ncbi:MAG: ABC transporter permease [Planctomycetes bacterium]|nr:ABC transporter permease [Planctomycetota bacterium]
MLQASSCLLAVRYLRSRWVNVLGIVGVAVAVWAMILVRAVFSGFIGNIQDDVRRTSTDLLVTDLPHDTGYASLRDAIAGVDGVAALAPRLRHFGVFHVLTPQAQGGAAQFVDFSSASTAFVQLVGIDPAAEGRVSAQTQWYQHEHERLKPQDLDATPADQADPIKRLHVPAWLEWQGRRRAGLPVPTQPSLHRTLSPGLLLSLDRLYSHHLEPGFPLDIISARFDGQADGAGKETVAIRERFTFAGAFKTRHRIFDDTTAIVPIETLRSMLGHDFHDDGSIDLITDVAIAVVAGQDPAVVQARVRQRVRALPGLQQANVLDWVQQNQVFLDAVGHERAMMQIVLFVVMLIAAFLVYATLHMMVAQKTKDIGILCAIGSTPRGIGATFLTCGIVIGLIGSLAGLVLGVLSTRWINPVNDWLFENFGLEMFPRRLFDLPEIPCRLEPAWLIGVPVAAFLLTLLVAWLPARRAARMLPVEALSYE